jgi:hypothetical protein
LLFVHFQPRANHGKIPPPHTTIQRHTTAANTPPPPGPVHLTRALHHGRRGGCLIWFNSSDRVSYLPISIIMQNQGKSHTPHTTIKWVTAALHTPPPRFGATDPPTPSLVVQFVILSLLNRAGGVRNVNPGGFDLCGGWIVGWVICWYTTTRWVTAAAINQMDYCCRGMTDRR